MKKYTCLSAITLILAVSPVTYSQSQNSTAALGASCTDRYMGQMNFTPEQQAKFQSLKALASNDAQTLQSQNIAMHDKINAIIQSEPLDETQLTNLVNERKELAGLMLRKRIEITRDAYRILNTDQRIVFMNMLNECS